MSIQAVKGVEIGDADLPGPGPRQRGARRHRARCRRGRRPRAGSAADRPAREDSRAGSRRARCVVVRATMKPLSTLTRPVLETVDLATGATATSFKERTDVTAVPAMGVVAEAMVALVLGVRGAAQVRRRLGARAASQHGGLPRRRRQRRPPRRAAAVTVRVVLVGLPGVGKTTVGRALAPRARRGLRRPRRRRPARGAGRGPPSAPAHARGAGLPGARDRGAGLGAGGRRSDGPRHGRRDGGVRRGPSAARAPSRSSSSSSPPPPRCSSASGRRDRPLLEDPSESALAGLDRRRGAWYAEVADATVDATGPVDGVVDAVAALVVRA